MRAHQRSSNGYEDDQFARSASVISESIELGHLAQEKRKPTPDELRVFNDLKNEVSTKAGKRFSEFDARFCLAQSIAGGTLYVVKFHIGNNRYVHAKVMVPSNKGKAEVRQVEANQTEDSHLTLN